MSGYAHLEMPCKGEYMRLDTAIKKHIPYRIRDRMMGNCPWCGTALKKYGDYKICWNNPRCKYGEKINPVPGPIKGQ